MIFIVLLILILIIAIYAFFSLLIFGAFSLAPYVPVKRSDLERISEIVGLIEGDFFYELGCGDGRVALYIGSRNNTHAIGIERSYLLYLVCLLKKYFYRNISTKFKRSDIFREKFEDGSILFIYAGSSRQARKIYDKLIADNVENAKLISYRFSVGNREPEMADRDQRGRRPIYVYLINSKYEKDQKSHSNRSRVGNALFTGYKSDA